MSKKTKGQKFEEAFYYWMGYFGFDLNKIPISKDNRCDTGAAVVCFEDNTIQLKYNSKRLAHLLEGELYSIVFHEIGHILQDLPCDTKEEEVYSELCAEIFSLTMMKRHYKKFVGEVINHQKKLMTNKNWQKQNPIHYQACKQIREYN